MEQPILESSQISGECAMRNAHIALCVLTTLVAFLMGCPPATPPANTDNLTDYKRTETLFEWYVEHYDANTFDSLEGRFFASDGSLTEYMVFQYSGGLNTGVRIYNSDQVTDDSSLIGEFHYTYDGSGNCTSGILQRKTDGVMTTESSFTATYNAQGNYLDCLVQDGSGAVIEHRVCTYDGTGENYLVETYYSDAATADMIEQYECTYDPVDTGRWIREDHYIKLSADDPANAYSNYTNYMAHTFTWNGDNMYLQTDFQSTVDKVAGEMISAIMYTYENGKAKTRSYFNQDGKLMSYRTYQHDTAGRLIELCHYNYNNSAGNELEAKETYTFYMHDGASMCDEKTYSYSYPSRSLQGMNPGSFKTRLETPEASHHCPD
jgi:hypothetical protein